MISLPPPWFPVASPTALAVLAAVAASPAPTWLALARPGRPGRPGRIPPHRIPENLTLLFPSGFFINSFIKFQLFVILKGVCDPSWPSGRPGRPGRPP